MRAYVLLVLIGLTQPTIADVRYRVVNLEDGSEVATSESTGIAINSKGQVVGNFWTADPLELHVFRYTDGIGMEDLGHTGGVTWASGINDLGQIAAYGNETLGGDFRPYRYTDDLGFVPLSETTCRETLTGGINNRGQVAGAQGKAFRYTDGVGLEELGSLYGGGSDGFGINERGWVTGASDGWNAYLYRDGLGMIYLGPGMGHAVNNNGAVVGGGATQGFYYRDGIYAVFEGFPGGSLVNPWSLNDFDEIVGDNLDQNNRIAAFIWNFGEGLRKLNDLIDPQSGWSIGYAYGINNAGQIVGEGYRNNKICSVRLDPIPPRMEIALAGTNVVISWSPHWPRLVLETAPYQSSTNWQAVPGVSNSPVTLPVSGAGQVFRLVQYPTLAPKLSVRASGENVVISWAPPWPDCALEFTADASASSWTLVPGASNSPVRLPATEAARFFRVIRP